MSSCNQTGGAAIDAAQQEMQRLPCEIDCVLHFSQVAFDSSSLRDVSYLFHSLRRSSESLEVLLATRDNADNVTALAILDLSIPLRDPIRKTLENLVSFREMSRRSAAS